MKYNIRYGFNKNKPVIMQIKAKSLLAAENYARIAAINMYDAKEACAGNPILTREMVACDPSLVGDGDIDMEDYFDKREEVIFFEAAAVEEVA